MKRKIHSMDKFEFAQRLQSDKARYYRIAYSYVKNEQDALDIVGDATYKALLNLRSLKNPEYFGTWMTPVSYTHLDVYKRQG